MTKINLKLSLRVKFWGERCTLSLHKWPFLIENWATVSFNWLFMCLLMHNIDCWYYFSCEAIKWRAKQKACSSSHIWKNKCNVLSAQMFLNVWWWVNCLLAYQTYRHLLTRFSSTAASGDSEFTASGLLQGLILLNGLRSF